MWSIAATRRAQRTYKHTRRGVSRTARAVSFRPRQVTRATPISPRMSLIIINKLINRSAILPLKSRRLCNTLISGLTRIDMLTNRLAVCVSVVEPMMSQLFGLSLTDENYPSPSLPPDRAFGVDSHLLLVLGTHFLFGWPTFS